jgi:hypothetical protein
VELGDDGGSLVLILTLNLTLYPASGIWYPESGIRDCFPPVAGSKKGAAVEL